MYDYPTSHHTYVSITNETALRNTVPEAREFTVTIDGRLTLPELRGLVAECERRHAALPEDLRASLPPIH